MNTEQLIKNNKKDLGKTPNRASPKTYNMRCPSCAKLYKVEADSILSSSPRFDCEVCHTAFTFDESPMHHPNSIQTRPLEGVLKNPSFQKAASLDFNENHFKKCPKCDHVNPKHVEECVKCHVIFSRLEGLNFETRAGALPSLLRMWQELLSDYDNLTKHVAFVNRCEDLQAIPFALKKYKSLKEAQPHDELAKKMAHQVLLKSLGLTADRVAEASKIKFLFSKVNWPRLVKLAPLVFGLVLVVFGLMSHPLRNLVGIGVALISLTVGLRFFKSGGILWDDFF